MLPARKVAIRRFISLLATGVLAAGLSTSCSRTGVDRALSLGEGFWQKGQYQQAVQEFEKVATRDPHSAKGVIALFRAAEIQAQFTPQHAEAVRKLRLFLDRSQDRALRGRAEELIGETLFLRMEDYSAARAQYQHQLAANPGAPRAVEWMLKIAKCERFLGRHGVAERILRDLIARYQSPSDASNAVVEAKYELAETLLLQGRQAEAESEFQKFIVKYPNSPWGFSAKLGLANSLEERRQWDAALQLYREIRDHVPSPPAVDVRVSRILERLRKKGDER